MTAPGGGALPRPPGHGTNVNPGWVRGWQVERGRAGTLGAQMTFAEPAGTADEANA